MWSQDYRGDLHYVCSCAATKGVLFILHLYVGVLIACVENLMRILWHYQRRGRECNEGEERRSEVKEQYKEEGKVKMR